MFNRDTRAKYLPPPPPPRRVIEERSLAGSSLSAAAYAW
jgi:hypothetical protein